MVSSRYEGDDIALAREQQYVYLNALRIIVDGCRVHFFNACRIAAVNSDEPPRDRRWPHHPLFEAGPSDRWPLEMTGIDHRTWHDAQPMHDLLAAAWRYRVRPPQRSLLDPDPACAEMDAWLGWLRAEVNGWNHYPDCVRFVMAIVTNPNREIATIAGEGFIPDLMARFKVPWAVKAV